jgi:hypothetical protein
LPRPSRDEWEGSSNEKRGPKGPRFFVSQKEKALAGRARCASTGCAATATGAAIGTRAEYRLRLHWQQAFALQLLAR